MIEAMNAKDLNDESIIDESFKKGFFDLAESLKLSEEQKNAIWKWIVGKTSEYIDETQSEIQNYCGKTEQELSEKFGDQYDSKKKAVIDLINRYGGPEFADFLRESGFANSKEVILFLMNLADACREDRGLVGEKSKETSSYESIKNEIEKLMSQPAYMQANHPDHKSVVEKAYALRQKLLQES